MSNNSVSLTTAQTAITNWYDYCGDKSLMSCVRAINIPLDSITPLLGTAGVSGIRAYIGLPDNSTMAGMHLYLVAVDSGGNDVIENSSTKQSMIMDFTTPCPSTCDTSSPLYTCC